MKLAARLDRMGQPLYAGLTKQTKGGAVWTGDMRRAHESVLMAPLKRKKPTTYFVNSMSDLFHENVPDEWIDRIFAVMALCPHHTFQVLTKRPARMYAYMVERWQPAKAQALDLGGGDKLDMPAETVGEDRRDQVLRAIDDIFAEYRDLKTKFIDTDNDVLWTDAGEAKCMQFSWPLPNVWLGTSAERQKESDERIPHLLRTPAAVRFVSLEPLLGPIDLNRIHEGYDTPEGARVDMWESCLNGKRYDMWAGDDEDPMQPGHPKLDWVIVGGESGHGHRDMDPAWAESILAQCKDAGTAVFMKQMSGRAEIPKDLMIRQFPKAESKSAD
jgi:protein gp37